MAPFLLRMCHRRARSVAFAFAPSRWSSGSSAVSTIGELASSNRERQSSSNNGNSRPSRIFAAMLSAARGAVVTGKVTEHLVPLMGQFPYNPKDVRFLGTPVDLIVFDGMDEDDLSEIVFVEVKTGASASLSTRERRIRDAVRAGYVRWHELRID